MVQSTARGFGQLIRERRRSLELTQKELGRRIKTSPTYVVLLEAGKRHPSEKVIARMANVLGLDSRELFLLANPGAQVLVSQPARVTAASTWDQFRKDHFLLRIHKVSRQEMETLSRVALMGEVRSSRDFIYILNAIRQALGR